MATSTELYIDTLGGLDLYGSTDKNLPYSSWNLKICGMASPGKYDGLTCVAVAMRPVAVVTVATSLYLTQICFHKLFCAMFCAVIND